MERKRVHVRLKISEYSAETFITTTEIISNDNERFVFYQRELTLKGIEYVVKERPFVLIDIR